MFNKKILTIYALSVLVGAVIGICFLLPVNEFVAFYEYRPTDEGTGFTYAFTRLEAALLGELPKKTMIYALVGAFIGLLSSFVYARFQSRLMQIEQLSDALSKDIMVLIEQGEGPYLEFKSSFRWDIKQDAVNKNLELAVLKTLAGFANAGGGTLLIGVADDQSVLGLHHDIQTLKRRDQDGYEQNMMAMIATQMGTDICQYVHCVFHSIDDKLVCRVIVAPSNRPVYIKRGKEVKFFVRAGGGTRELNVQEAFDYSSKHWA